MAPTTDGGARRTAALPADRRGRAVAAIAAGFLFFLVTIAMSVPGGVILAWEGLRGGAGRARVDEAPLAVPLSGRAGSARVSVGNDRSIQMGSNDPPDA